MKIKKIFCVIDPTTTNQPALLRGAAIAQDIKAALHAYVCIPGTNNLPAESRDAMREAEVARHEAWLAQMMAPFHKAKIKTSWEVECNDDWREALAPAAKRANADLIIKANYPRTAIQRRVMKTSDWVLLRGAHCPVLFVKSKQTKPVDTILAAINLNAEGKEYQELNDMIIDSARAIAKASGAKLHAVNAYDGSENFVHPPMLAKKVGIPREQAHVGDAEPEELVAKVAKSLGAPLVIIGTVARKGMKGAVVGNTAERLLDILDSEVLVITKPRR